MTLQTLFRRTLATLLAGFAACALAAEDRGLVLIKVADGVYVHRGALAEANPQNLGDIANIGFIVGTNCVAVIDTGGTFAIGAALLAALRQITSRPVCYVINTHVHPDHVFGNAAFAPEKPAFVGHAHLAAAMAARSDSYLASLSEQVGDAAAQGSLLIPPTVSVPAETDMPLDLGGRSVIVHAWPTAHTDSDLTVVDTQTGTLWTGDLLFVEHIPVIDGSLLGWLRAMAMLSDMSPRHVIPGHGPIDPPWPAAIANQSRYLGVIASDVRSALKTDRTLQQTIDRAGLSERSRWRLFEDYNRRNVTAGYTELEWEQ